MNEHSVVIIGLPGSGKTTFLAALWHLISARDVETALKFDTLGIGSKAHLNEIAARWRNAQVQDRTGVGGHRVVTMQLKNAAGAPVRVTFPDVAGEAFRRMWEERDCPPDIAEIVKAGSVLLFIHSDTIRPPKWVVDEVTLSREAGLPMSDGEEVPWHPRLAPTQVQLVDLLQLLRAPPLDVGRRRLAIMLSAWDKASGEGLSPQTYLERKLPMLAQYLRSGADGWTWQVYGLSAQGGDYDPVGSGGPQNPQAQTLRNLDRPSTRIQVVAGNKETHDLTEPLAWLME